MIREPYGVSPYNNTIDTNTPDSFSFYFSGDKLESCKFSIYESNTDATNPLYTSSVQDFPNIYNDSIVKLKNNALGINGKNLIWNIKMWENNAIFSVGTGVLSADVIGLSQFSIGTNAFLASVSNFSKEIINVFINGESQRITGYNNGSITISKPFQTKGRKGNSFIIYSNRNGSNSNYATILVGNGKVRIKPEDEEGKAYLAPNAKNFYIEKTTKLKLGVSVDSYEGMTITIGGVSVGIEYYDYYDSLITTTQNITYSTGSEYYIKNAKGLTIVNGTVQSKPEDIPPVVYPVIDSTHFYIGQHPKLKNGISSDVLDYVEIQIGNEKRKVTAYDYSIGYVTVSSAMTASIQSAYTLKTNYMTSSSYFFKGREKPVVDILGLSSGVNTLTQREYQFIGTYSQTDGDMIKYHSWKIYNGNKKLVFDSGKIFNANLELFYKEFKNNSNYSVQLTVVTQNEIQATSQKLIYISYDDRKLRLLPKATVDKNSNSIEVTIPKNQFSNPSTDCSIDNLNPNIFNTTPAKTGVQLNESSYLEYNNLSEDKLIINGDNFTFSSAFNIDLSAEGEIFYMKNEGGTNSFSLIKKNASLYIDINKTLTKIYDIFPEESWLSTGVAQPNKFYVWNANATWGTSANWLGTISNTAEKVFKMYITPTSFKLYLATPSTMTEIVSLQIDLRTQVYNLFGFKQKVGIDYLFLLGSIIDQNGISSTLPWTYEPSWENFDLEGVILCSYLDSLSSSSNEYITEIITGYLIYRCELNIKNEIVNEDFICSLDALAYPNLISIKDYSANNNTRYKYKVFPMTNEITLSFMESNNVYSDWEYWTFTEVKLNKDEGRYYPVSNPWQFKLNINPGAMSVTTGRAIHTNLSEFPKATIGPQKYITQPFSCLLGNFNESTYERTINGDILNPREYRDDYEKINAWIDFVNTPNPILVQSTKGLNYLATIDGVTVAINEYIPEQPTTVSFNLTQIGNLQKEQVIGIIGG